MKLSARALDQIATRLSQLDAPDIPELKLTDDKTLQNNMLESILGIFSGDKNSPIRHMMTDMVRRIFASCETYKLARHHALQYIELDRYAHITPYFQALTFFESCVSYSWQVADLARKSGKHNLFKRGEGSAWERLHGLYTHGTKHSSEQYDAVARPELPTTIWLTNQGIACISGAEVTYLELSEIIIANNDLFYFLQKRVREKLIKTRGGYGNLAQGGKLRLM